MVRNRVKFYYFRFFAISISHPRQKSSFAYDKALLLSGCLMDRSVRSERSPTLRWHPRYSPRMVLNPISERRLNVHCCQTLPYMLFKKSNRCRSPLQSFVANWSFSYSVYKIRSAPKNVPSREKRVSSTL